MQMYNKVVLSTPQADFKLSNYNGEWFLHFDLNKSFSKEMYEDLLLDLTEFEDYVIINGLINRLCVDVPVEDKEAQKFVPMFGFTMVGVYYDKETNEEAYYKYEKELKHA